MKPIKTVTIDLNRPQRNVVQMVQGDTSRRVLVNLLLNGNPYDVSTDYDGTIVKGVEYIKANGIGGYYETASTGDDAVTAGTNSNQWIVAIDNHATDVPGFAECFVKFSTADGYVLHSFPITLYVDQSAASGGTDPNEPYYQSASFLIAGNQAAKTSDMTSPVGVDENGKLWVAPDNSFTSEAKSALLNLLSQVAYIDQNGQTLYDALETALYPEVHLTSITAAYDQDRPIYNTSSLDLVRLDLIVTANYSDGTSERLADDAYELTGTLTVGTSTITATYRGKTATFSVTVASSAVPIGTPSVSDNILTPGSSGMIRSMEAFSPGSSPWKIQVGFTTGASLSGYQDLIGSVSADGTSQRGFLMEQVYYAQTQRGAVAGYGSNNGSGWNLFSGTIDTTVVANTTYLIQLEFTGSKYEMQYSTDDGATWSPSFNPEVSDSNAISGGYYIGIGLNRNGYYGGTIDLTKIKVWIDGELWWKVI